MPILKMCEVTAKELVKAYNGKAKLVFPLITKTPSPKKVIRISEQEARVLFCKTIEATGNFNYSIETPTSNQYIFSEVVKGKRVYCEKKDSTYGQSGSIDLVAESIDNTSGTARSIDLEKNHPQRYNIEFKAKNVDKHSIHKDFLKLEHENGNAVFFHTLKNATGSTFTSLIDKFRSYEGDGRKGELTEKKILIVIVVLKDRMMYHLKKPFKDLKILPLIGLWKKTHPL